MVTQRSLTSAQLALYFGCKVSTDFGIGSIDAIASYNSVFVCFDNYDEYETIDMPVDEVKPILRKWSSLTEKEYQRIYELGKAARSNSTSFPKAITMSRGEIQIGYAIGYPPIWQYLLSIVIDLFGWIDAGLAVDAKTIEK